MTFTSVLLVYRQLFATGGTQMTYTSVHLNTHTPIIGARVSQLLFFCVVYFPPLFAFLSMFCHCIGSPPLIYGF